MLHAIGLAVGEHGGATLVYQVATESRFVAELAEADAVRAGANVFIVREAAWDKLDPCPAPLPVVAMRVVGPLASTVVSLPAPASRLLKRIALALPDEGLVVTTADVNAAVFLTARKLITIDTDEISGEAIARLSGPLAWIRKNELR